MAMHWYNGSRKAQTYLTGGVERHGTCSLFPVVG